MTRAVGVLVLATVGLVGIVLVGAGFALLDATAWLGDRIDRLS